MFDPRRLPLSGNVVEVDTLSDEQHRALAFVASATRGGYEPDQEDLEAWTRHHQRRSTGGIMSLSTFAMEAYDSAMKGTRESMTSHLLNLRWLDHGRRGGLSPTRLGEALLKDADAGVMDVQTVVFGRDDPLAYRNLIGELTKTGPDLLVDPYLDVDSLHAVLEHTPVKRILVGDKLREGQLSALRVFWQGLTDPGVIIRLGTDLHDRVVLGVDGAVWAIGASLNTVAKGKSSTTLTPILREGAEALRHTYEDYWERAKPLVEPEPPADEASPATP